MFTPSTLEEGSEIAGIMFDWTENLKNSSMLWDTTGLGGEHISNKQKRFSSH